MTINNEDLIGNIMPNVHLSRIILQSNKDDKLIGNVQFVLQDTFNNEDTYSWIEENSDALKYLSLIIVQSADEEITNHIQETVKKFGTEDTRRLLDAIAVAANPQKLSFTIFQPFPTGKTLQQLVNEDKAERLVNSDGSDTYNIYFDIDMPSEIDESPEHLTYLFLSYYNLSSLLRDDFADSVSNQDGISLGVEELVVENVISNGELVTKTNIFLNEQGEIWPGLIHTIDRRGQEIYRSGQTEDENSFDLKLEQIENYKVQDFRELKRMTAVQSLDPGLFENGFLDQFEKIDFERELIDKDNRNIISDLYPSIDSDGRIALTFALDFKKLFMYKSLYGSALSKLETPSIKNYIDKQYKMAKIESIILSSKRVDIDDSLTNIKQQEVIVGQYSGDEDISTIEKNIFFKSVDRALAEQLRIFSISDLSKRDKKGVYQYFVEIEYLDNVIEQMQSYISELENERKKFLEFYEQAIYPNKFNITSNRFRANAFSSFSEIADITDFSISGQNYLSVVETLFNINAESLLTIVNNWLSPIQGTPDTIYSVIQLYNNLINNLQNSISITPSVNNSMNEKNEGFAESKKTQSDSKSIKIKKTFATTISLDHKFKYEYLDMLRPDNTGITNSSPYMYEVLKTDLISKKFSNDVSLTIVNKDTEIDSKVYTNLVDLMAENANLNIKRTKEIQLINTENRQQSLLRAIRPFENSFIKEKVSNFLTKDVNPQDYRQINAVILNLLNATVSQDSDMSEISFVTNMNERKNIFWKIDAKKFTDVGGKDTKITGLFKNKSFTKSDILNLPNHIKSLIKMRLEAPDSVLGDAEVRFKYELIKKVQVLDGFKYNVKNGCFNLKFPLWKTLTDPSELEEESIILCKLEDYQNDKIGYKFNQALKEISINQYFFINNSGIDNGGKIENGATQISLATFENRCNKEISKYYDGQELPDIKFSSGSRIINQDDNFKRAKYSFLAPYGIYFDEFYKIIGTHLLEINVTAVQIAIPIDKPKNDTFKYPGLKFVKNIYKTLPAIKQKFNPIVSSIYSRTGKVDKR